MSTPDLKRLPPNPRRNKVAPDRRKRVVTACNHCNIRRIKCSGDQPCLQCSKLSRDCQYPAPVEKITIPRSELEHLRQRCAALETQLIDAGLTPWPSGAGRSAGPAPSSSSVSTPGPTPDPTTPTLSAATPSQQQQQQQQLLPPEDDDVPPTHGRLLRDSEGRARYMGETAGATFLDALKSFMLTAIPLAFKANAPDCLAASPFLGGVGEYQTLDSRPVLLPSVDPLWLPPRAEMDRLLFTLRCFFGDGNGTYPSGGVCFWGKMADVPPAAGLATPASSTAVLRSLAFYHTAFACATLVGGAGVGINPGPGPGPPHQGEPTAEAYLARARALLGNPLDTSLWSVSDIPALGLMAVYLAEQNRRDAAYMSISSALHIAVMHGIHKGWSVDESGKRVFWTLFIIDRWMSLLMGRPASISDDAITLSLPEEYPGLPPPFGLRASVQLSRITNFITINGYRMTPRSFPPGSSTSYFDQALAMLDEWVAGLPPVLRLAEVEVGHDRTAICLHLACNQLIMLVIRPILILVVKKGVADQFTRRSWNIEDHPQIHRLRQCSDAARGNLRLGRWLREVSPAHKLLLPDLHYIFNAAVILMLHQIVFVNLRTNDVSDIEFAVEAFEREAAAGAVYAVVCAGILKDLLALVHKLRSLAFDSLQLGGGNSLASSPLPGEQTLLHLASSGPMMSGADAQPDIHLAPGDDIFQVLEAWLRADDVHLYNSFLI